MMTAAWVMQGWGTSGGALPDQDAYSPAFVVAQYLIDSGVVTVPAPSAAWPIYISSQPAAPINVVTAFDSPGIISAQTLSPGVRVEHEGVSVRIRGSNYQVGYSKALSVYNSLKAVRREVVNFSNATYRLDNVSLQGPVLSIGQEEDTRRDVFVVNCRTSITPLVLP